MQSTSCYVQQHTQMCAHMSVNVLNTFTHSVPIFTEYAYVKNSTAPLARAATT